MKTSTVVLYLVLFGLAAEVVVLGLQKRKQKEMITDLVAGQSSFAPAPSLEPGDRLAPFPELTAPDGARQSLLFDASQPHRLLYFFNTRCPACGETIPSWNRLARSLSDGARALAVTRDPLDEVADYVRRRDLDYPVLSLGGADYKDLSRVAFVPYTVLVDPAGIVLGVWPNRLDAVNERRIENLLASALGLPPE